MKAKNQPDRRGQVLVAARTHEGAAGGSSGGGGGTAAGRVVPAATRAPRMEYDSERKKWVVENQVGQLQEERKEGKDRASNEDTASILSWNRKHAAAPKECARASGLHGIAMVSLQASSPFPFWLSDRQAA